MKKITYVVSSPKQPGGVKKDSYEEAKAEMDRQMLAGASESGLIQLSVEFTCNRCGHQWSPDNPVEPKTCANPKCKSPYWNKERKYPKR